MNDLKKTEIKRISKMQNHGFMKWSGCRFYVRFQGLESDGLAVGHSVARFAFGYKAGNK